MKNITTKEEELKNIERPFTELFSLLKRYDEPSLGLPMLAYRTDELTVIYQHINNAIDTLLEGLQGMGMLIGTATSGKKSFGELHRLGFFISAITNLTEALSDLRLDTDHVLKERGVVNF